MNDVEKQFWKLGWHEGEMDDQSWPSNVFLHKIIEIQQFFWAKKIHKCLELVFSPCCILDTLNELTISPHIFSFVAWANYKIWKFELLDVGHTRKKTTNLAWETWMRHCKGKKESMICPYTIGVLAFNLKTL